MNTANDRTDTAFNITNVALGVILIAAPWLLGFTGEVWASRNAWFSGGVVVLLALLALVRTYDWEEWLNVIAGLWITASPWLLWFEDVAPARWTHVIIGLCIIVFAALELRHLYLTPKDMLASQR
jgi:hypothetical protein